MEQIATFFGPVKIYTPEETSDMFTPLRESIFDMSESVRPLNKRILVNDT